MSKSIQIKAGTTRQETALTVVLKIHINTRIKHQTVNKDERGCVPEQSSVIHEVSE